MRQRRQYRDEAGQPIPGWWMSAGDSGRLNLVDQKIRAGIPEWVAKGYHAPFDCPDKVHHDKARHGDPNGCGCGCVCDAAGNRLN